MIKNIIDSKNIIIYTRYVDDILIIYDHSKITSKRILQFSNTGHNNL